MSAAQDDIYVLDILRAHAKDIQGDLERLYLQARELPTCPAMKFAPRSVLASIDYTENEIRKLTERIASIGRFLAERDALLATQRAKDAEIRALNRTISVLRSMDESTQND